MTPLKFTFKIAGREHIAHVQECMLKTALCEVDLLHRALSAHRPKSCGNRAVVTLRNARFSSGLPPFELDLCDNCVEENIDQNLLAWAAAFELCKYVLLQALPSAYHGRTLPAHSRAFIMTKELLEESKHFCEHDGCMQPAWFESPSYEGRGLQQLCTRHAVKWAMLPEFRESLESIHGKAVVDRHLQLVDEAWPTHSHRVVRRPFPTSHYTGDGDSFSRIKAEILILQNYLLSSHQSMLSLHVLDASLLLGVLMMLCEQWSCASSVLVAASSAVNSV